MYAQGSFREERIEALQRLIVANDFATLVAASPDGMIAAHLPLILDAGRGVLGVLRGHLARQNPFCRAVAEGVPALAIFAGPNCYVSPQWYPSKAVHGRVVPTWNYVAVHARGSVIAVNDPTWIRAQLTALTDKHEAQMDAPWAITDAPDDFVARMIESIVGIELTIAQLEGIEKLSQNRTDDDRAGVLDNLERQDDAGSAAIAALMRAKT